jgi:hypothetical protein
VTPDPSVLAKKGFGFTPLTSSQAL